MSRLDGRLDRIFFPSRGVAFVCSCLFLTSCIPVQPTLYVSGYKVSAESRTPNPSALFLAGVAKLDITPPPGFPTGGHGPAGHLARGYWTRLFARAFYFEDSKGNRLAMVSCDLFAIPEALHAAVARNVRRSGITPDEIVLAATHTHQGPGNYMSAAIHNEFGSRWPGFSRDLFNFFALRISEAIRCAVKDAHSKPAEADLIIKEGRLSRLTMNRAPMAFLLNRERDELMNDLNPGISPDPKDCLAARNPKWPLEHWDVEGCPRLRAADNSVTVLEVVRNDATIGIMTFLSIHPTVLHHDSELYSSDFLGRASTLLEQDGKTVAAAVFNGADGDIVAQRTTRTFADVESLANLLVSCIRDVMTTTGQSIFSSVEDRTVRGRHNNIVGGGGPECPPDKDSKTKFRLAGTPRFGVATIGGAEEDRSPLYRLGWIDGITGIPDEGQGPKQRGLHSPIVPAIELTDWFAHSWKYPAHLPITFIEIGDLGIVTTSVEMTTAMGYRIRKDLLAQTELPWLVLIGFVNDYANYVTTPEEYIAQGYEAASTIWGAEEGPFLNCELQRLAVKTYESPTLEVADRSFKPGLGANRAFGPSFTGDARQTAVEGLEDEATDHTGRPAVALPWCSWSEFTCGVRKRCKTDRTPNACQPGPDYYATRIRSVSIEVQRGESWNETTFDDKGSSIATMLLNGKRRSKREWSAVWLDAASPPPAGVYRFHIRTPDGQELCSDGFEIPTPSGSSLRIDVKACDKGGKPSSSPAECPDG